MPKLNPPPEFDFSKPGSWPEWKRRSDRYRLATELDEKAQRKQVNSLLYCMGHEAEKIYENFHLAVEVPENAAEGTVADAYNFDTVIRRFDTYFVPRRNVIFERARFHQRHQKEGESAENFYRALLELSENCNFHDRNEEIRDQMVVSILDKDVRIELQGIADLTLEYALDRIRSYELLKNQNESTY